MAAATVKVILSSPLRHKLGQSFFSLSSTVTNSSALACRTALQRIQKHVNHSNAIINNVTAATFSSLAPARDNNLLSTKSYSNEVVQFVRLNNIHDNPGAVKAKRRVGRGPGSSKGKTCGRGHKGQKARSGGKIPPTFEGGQTKLYKRLPKRGYSNKVHEAPQLPLNLGTLQTFIDMGRLKVGEGRIITLRDLVDAGIFKASAIKHGVKLLADGKDRFNAPDLRIHISRASEAAIDAIEAMGGEVTTVHYNQLALRALLRPNKFTRSVKQARPPPKYQPYYTGWKNRGYLNPVVQLRTWLKTRPELEEKFQTILRQQSASIKSE